MLSAHLVHRSYRNKRQMTLTCLDSRCIRKSPVADTREGVAGQSVGVFTAWCYPEPELLVAGDGPFQLLYQDHQMVQPRKHLLRSLRYTPVPRFPGGTG